MHGRRLLSTYFFPRSWSLCRPAPGTPRGKAWGALSAGTERHPHTPGRDWPAAQSLRADTSGQPLPRSSRLLFPALGKKSGQRGAGTKDPAVHGERRLRATPYLTPGSNALAGRLRVPTRRPRGVLARGSPNRSPHLASDSGRNHVYGPRWPPLSSGGSSFLAVRWARSRGPPSPQRGGARRSPPRRRKVPDHRARPVPTPQPPRASRQPQERGAPRCPCLLGQRDAPHNHHLPTPPSPSRGARVQRVTWVISEEMAKFISGAPTGCRRKALKGARGDRAGGCGRKEITGVLAGTRSPPRRAQHL